MKARWRKEKPETVAALNHVLRKIKKKSGVKVLANVDFRQWNEDCADYIFGCTPAVFSDIKISGAEFAHYADGDPHQEKLTALVKCRIGNGLQDMINLLQDDLDLLRAV